MSGSIYDDKVRSVVRWADDARSWMTPDELVDRIARGRPVEEREFDRYLPDELRVISALHWTPLKIAAYGARWLASRGVRSVIDVGSGAGKFCVIAALATDCSFTGIEQRARLVDVARGLARFFRVSDRATFTQEVFTGGALPRADAYYLFNPFGENILEGYESIDHDVELSDHRYLCDVDAMERSMREAPVGTHFLMYNGFGGAIPESYEEVKPQADAPDRLCLWQKVR